MAIQSKDLGRYKRPGIFINEIDQSIVELPVQNVLINLVPGFSKKGPVNRPIYVTNPNDFETIFGEVDRGLEKKGSFFHRTCLKMLQSGPIWALNLLSTNDTRDKLNWKSISCASAYDNAATRQMPYSRIFNRQDFWTRDDESLLDYINDPTPDEDRLLHITNLGEKTITVFVYKSSVSGFNVTAEDWYGGVTKVPTYIHPKDWISDYMVSVLVLMGDWTDYDNLSVDTTWGNYFTTDGLDKTTLQDFVNETNVTVAAYYDCSLIPYFKDIDGRDMYIKSVINNNTDKTGLFCAYNESLLLDGDYPIGKMDILGNGIVGQETTEIDFLSYQESIIEEKTYEEAPLDSHNNVFGNYSRVLTDSFKENSRTASKTNWYVGDGVKSSTSGSTLVTISVATHETGKSWLCIDYAGTVDFGTAPVNLYHQALTAGDAIYLNKAYGGLSANTLYYIEETTSNQNWFSLTTTAGGTAINFDTTQSIPSNFYIQRAEQNFTIPVNSYFNLGGAQYTFDTGVTEFVFEPLTLSSTAIDNAERYDVLYLTEGSDTVNILKGTQGAIGAASQPDFEIPYEDAIILGYARLYIASGCTSTGSTDNAIFIDYTPITINSSGYMTLTDIIITGYTLNNVNYIVLKFGNTSGSTEYNNYTKLRYRAAYDEMESYLDDGKGVIIDYTNAYKCYIENGTFTDYSTMYDAYIEFSVGSTDWNNFYNTDNSIWLIYYLDNEFMIGSTNTDRVFSTLAPVESLGSSGQSSAAGVIGKYSDLYLDVYDGVLSNDDFAYVNNDTGSTDRIYIKTWIQGTDTMYIDFMANDKITPEPIEDWSGSDYNSQIIIWSNESNFKQTLEIEYLDVTKYPNLVYEIKVDKTRYSEVVKGNFIEAYYDETLYESGGALYGYEPRKLTRIISTTIDSTNTDWKVIKTDAPIKVSRFLQTDATTYDYQTTVYPQIDIYVDTYKGISLIPFTIHADSIPNNTEDRQSSILDVIGKTTNLAKGLINKNKISWRYMIDSFGLGLTDQSKQQLVDLCGTKLNCLGFINAPSVRTLKASSNPSFINDDRTLNTEYLMAGGDESQNPSFLYSFGTGVGRSCVGYFFPYVTVDDQGIPKDVPPSAWAATTYMNKFISGISQPWTICAGISNGRITDIAGVEMDFTNENLENLYSMNLNPIIKLANAGYCINSESTAQVFPYSSLSLIHSREVLIELENSLYDMLLRYQWRFNTPEIRAEIKYRADKICKDLQDLDALYSFKNVIDETNNTNYIIDLQMGVLDTFVEIIKGMGMIVNNITILRKGDIESGGFA